MWCCYLFVARYDVRELPCSNEDDLADWCKARWSDKERMLQRFYEHREFSSGETRPSADVSVHDSAEKNSAVDHSSKEKTSRSILTVALILWVVFMCASIFMLWHSSVVRYIFAFQFVFFSFVKTFTAGFEHIQMDVFNRFQARSDERWRCFDSKPEQNVLFLNLRYIDPVQIYK